MEILMSDAAALFTREMHFSAYNFCAGVRTAGVRSAGPDWCGEQVGHRRPPVYLCPGYKLSHRFCIAHVTLSDYFLFTKTEQRCSQPGSHLHQQHVIPTHRTVRGK